MSPPAQRQPRPPGPAPARPLRCFRRRRPPAPDPPFPSIAEPCERRQVAGRRAPSSSAERARRAEPAAAASLRGGDGAVTAPELQASKRRGGWGRRREAPGPPQPPRRGAGRGRGGGARVTWGPAGAVPGRAVLRGRVAPRARRAAWHRPHARPARAPPPRPHRGTAGPGCGIRAAYPQRHRGEREAPRPRRPVPSLARRAAAIGGSARGRDSAGGSPSPAGRNPARPRWCRSAVGPAGAPQTPRAQVPRRAGRGDRSRSSPAAPDPARQAEPAHLQTRRGSLRRCPVSGSGLPWMCCFKINYADS